MNEETLVTKIIDNESVFEDYEEESGFITYCNQIIDQDKDHEAKILFFSQCAIVFTNFELNLKEIIRRAGYIQSIGELIYLSKWEDIDRYKISRALKDYFEINNKKRKLIFYKLTDNEGIDNKLSNLLIDNLRYHIGPESFQTAESSILKEVEDFAISKSLKEEKEPVFFIKDAGEVNDNSSLKNFYSGRNLIEYSICYISEYKKDNSIHYLDDIKECKPFWAGIYTTPHRLMNAMLNLAKVKEESFVVDPFSHTGTLIIEASQIGCKVKAFDLHEIQGAEDNYNFLCQGGENIIKTCEGIRNRITDKLINEKLQKILENSIHPNSQGLPEVNEGKRIEDLMKEHDLLLNFENRILFYLLRRYEMEKHRRIDLTKIGVIDFVKLHIDDNKIGGQLKHIERDYYTFFGNQMKAFEEENKENEFPILYLTEEVVDEYGKNFTDSMYRTNRIGYINLIKEKPEFKLKDVLKDDYDIEENSVDAIVTDPPYGYGEELTIDEIREIYKALFEKSFKWLKQMGVLVFCALDKVKTGRISNLLFTEDIIEIANSVARKSNVYFNLNYFYPTQIQKNCLYYWKSKYALNRSIIVLKINKTK